MLTYKKNHNNKYSKLTNSYIDKMREEASNWWQQALKDLESAKKNLTIEAYYITSFLSQQAKKKL